MSDLVLYFEYHAMCGLLNHPDWMAFVPSWFESKYFSSELCQDLFAEIKLNPKARLIDIIRKFSDKHSTSAILDVDNFTPLCKCEDMVRSFEIVADEYKDRQLRELGQQLVTAEDAEEINERINSVRTIGKQAQGEDVNREYMEEMERLAKGEKDSRLLPTGFTALDNIMQGMRNSELIILGGRPASGKTTLGMNIAYNAAKSGKKVWFYSLEMSEFELHKRLVSSIAGLNAYVGMGEATYNRLIDISLAVKDRLPLRIEDNANMTVEDIYLAAQKAKKQKDLDFVVIDHLSILKSKKTFKSRYEEVSEVSRMLKVMAKDLDVPVLCLCQLNRGLEGRELKMPTMADLRDSGSIEQDADLIMFVYRPEYNLRQKEPDDPNSNNHLNWEDEMRKVAGVAKIGIAKNRRGETGIAQLCFEGKYSRFTEAA